jgi:nucleoside phosphorylase
MGGTPFSIGRKDIRLRRNSYIMKIKWVSQKFVVLWDVGEERGWLVNGASALLHLVRGSLAQDQLDSRFGSLCSFRSADFQEALKLHQTDAALEVILNQNNLQVKIYSEDEGNVRFKDYVEDFYDLLEKMIDYQFKAVGTGHDASRIPRSLLEGWDFNDLTTGRDPVYPRQALLHQDGLSWVDFTRSVHAITLFGRGFGEIIQPARVSCSSWTKLPQGRSYLAAGVTDLHNIMESDGDPYSTPVKLTHDVLWYTTDEKFAQCRCKTDATPCDLAHILLPSRLHREMTASRSRLPKKGGAVIFGSNSVHKWFWGDLGDPSKTPSESNCLSSSSSSLGNAINDPQSDSGIGRSLSYSASGLAGSVSDPYDEYSGSTHAGISESEYYQPSNHTKSHLSRYSSPVARRYQVGIVCALHLELMAVRVLFDETHEKVAISDDDPNYYALGSIAGHNIVAVCLPHGLYGTNVAADVTSNMKRSFPTLKFCLLVGIGAGVPSPKNDIRLGDVVISTPKGGYSGVLPYDMIKSSDSGVSELNGYLCPPPSHLMCAISELESDPSLSSTPLQESLNQIHECKEEYKHPGTIHDQLFGSLYVHKDSHDTCDHCDPHHEIKRPPRLSTHPKLHYGLIASGNQVMKSAQIRDRLSKEHNVLCFEMEGAGIMNNFPCLIIRGICDYADSHKNKRWQNYAAAVAAAYAKLLLSRLKDSNNRVDGGLAESTSDYRQRSRKRPPSVESTEEHLTKRGRGEND